MVEGEDAVKQGGEIHLPKLSGQEQREYDAYLMRACFYAASSRSVKGLTGVVTRKPSEVIFPEKAKDTLLASITNDGESLDTLAKHVLEEVLSVGRVGLLVDAPEGGGVPYVTVYYAENIINWEETMLLGDDGQSRNQLTMAVLCEHVLEKDPEDPFKWNCVEQYRVLRLDFSGDSIQSRAYTVELWREREVTDDRGRTSKEWVMIGESSPAFVGGKKPNYIPFTFVNTTCTSAECEKSPILDLVNVNLSHYRNSADLEHGRHFTALPTPWAAGFDLKGDSLKIGSSRAWVTDNPQASAGFLEFSGAGLNSLVEALKEKEHMMAVLGARLLEEQKREAETATAVLIRQSGESATLSTVSSTCSEGMTKILSWVAEWANVGNPDDVAFAFPKKFDYLPVDAPTLTAMMQAYQGGVLSFPAWFNALQRAELYPDGWTEEQERDAIAAGGPMSPAGELDAQATQIGVQQQKEQFKQLKNDPLNTKTATTGNTPPTPTGNTAKMPAN